MILREQVGSSRNFVLSGHFIDFQQPEVGVIGKKQGTLTVLREQKVFEHNGSKWIGRNYLLLQCDCGTKVLNRKKDFGKTKICQKCNVVRNKSNLSPFRYKKKTIEERMDNFLKKEKGQLGAERAFNHYIWQAKKRGYEWKISFDEFKAIVSQDCNYCGAPPSQVHKTYVNIVEAQEHTNFVRNGIDRVNNKIGYVSENVVACCKECNFAKKDMSVENFIAMAKRIASKAS